MNGRQHWRPVDLLLTQALDSYTPRTDGDRSMKTRFQHDPALVVDHVLSFPEREAFTRRVLGDGREPADWIDQAMQEDAYLSVVEPMSPLVRSALAEILGHDGRSPAEVDLVPAAVYACLGMKGRDFSPMTAALLAARAAAWIDGYTHAQQREATMHTPELTPGTKMPEFTISGDDILAAEALGAYADLCERYGLRAQAAQVEKALTEMTRWQVANRSEVHWPSHPHVSAEPRDRVHDTDPRTFAADSDRDLRPDTPRAPLRRDRERLLPAVQVVPGPA
jgi:hypothetical protein